MPRDFKGVMHEWKQGKLHSGSKHGPKVTSQKQAEAIAFSEQRKMDGDHGMRKQANRTARKMGH